MGRGDVQSDVLHEIAEVFVLRHEIGLAIHFDQHADFALQMNVGSDNAFLGRAGRFLARAGDALCAQNRLGFSKSPPASVSARLQSIMPALVFSRSCFTIWGSISMRKLSS